jgi:anti-sigma regulatory factor (Ser/Thr protein kinase)
VPATAELRIGPEAADPGRLHPWLDAALGAWKLPGQLRHGMHVALEEAVTNVAMHAFDPGVARDIVVRLIVSTESVVLIVEDGGRPFDPAAAPLAARPANLGETRPGGLGLTLLHHYCSDISHERVEGRNRLTLRFTVPQGQN